jgi:hypothetical protein
MLKAACTTLSCPDGEGGEYKIEPLVVNQGKFTGKGYQLDRPSDAYFKRVQVFDRVTARPGSVLLRDKKNPDIAIFSNVEQIKNSDFTWKPTIIEVLHCAFAALACSCARIPSVSQSGVMTD